MLLRVKCKLVMGWTVKFQRKWLKNGISEMKYRTWSPAKCSWFRDNKDYNSQDISGQRESTVCNGLYDIDGHRDSRFNCGNGCFSLCRVTPVDRWRLKRPMVLSAWLESSRGVKDVRAVIQESTHASETTQIGYPRRLAAAIDSANE